MARFDGNSKIEANTLGLFGIKSYEPDYSATISVALTGGKLKHIIKPSTLTGNCTIDATFGDNVGDFEEVTLVLTADGTNRTVTPTGNVSGSAVVVTASTTKIVDAIIVAGKVILKS